MGSGQVTTIPIMNLNWNFLFETSGGLHTYGNSFYSKREPFGLIVGDEFVIVENFAMKFERNVPTKFIQKTKIFCTLWVVSASFHCEASTSRICNVVICYERRQ